jgi:hypothetical protein
MYVLGSMVQPGLAGGMECRYLSLERSLASHLGLALL